MSLRKIIKESLEDFGWTEMDINPWLEYQGIIFDVEPTPEDVNKYIEMALNTIENLGNYDAWERDREDDVRSIIGYQKAKGKSLLVAQLLDYVNMLHYADEISYFRDIDEDKFIRYSTLKNINESNELDWIKNVKPPTDPLTFFEVGKCYCISKLSDEVFKPHCVTFERYEPNMRVRTYDDDRGVLIFGQHSYTPLYIEEKLKEKNLTLYDLELESHLNLTESDEWDWVRDAPSFSLGGFLSDAEVCEDSGDNCDININDGEIVFVLDYEDLKNHVGLGDDFIIGDLFIHGSTPSYGGYGLRGEIDDHEINYLNYHLTYEQTNRFNNILEILTNGSVTVGDLTDDNFSDIEHYLFYSELKKMWASFIWDYLAPLEAALEENTRRYLDELYDEILKDSQIEVEVDSGYYRDNQEIKITVPIKVLTNKNEYNLSDALIELLDPFVSIDWHEEAYSTYDLSGSEDETERVVNKFLDDVEEFLEDTGKPKEYHEFLDLIKELKLKPLGKKWTENTGSLFFYTTKISDDLYIAVSELLEGNKVYLIKKKSPISKYSNSEIMEERIIPVDKLKDYIFSPTLDL